MSQGIVIENFSPEWASTFETLKAKLTACLGHLALNIEHVGSTAVNGLPAKPIIDMDVVIDSEALLPAVITRLAQIGYRYEGDLGIAGRHAFKTSRNAPAHHLYVCAKDSVELQRHLAFRDYLRSYAETANEYAALKYQLASSVGQDRIAYSVGKQAFIEDVLSRAGELSRPR